MSKRRGVYVLDAKRTPFGKFFGSLKNVSAVQLASEAIEGLTARLKLALGSSNIGVDLVLLGNVYSAGLGGAPARQVVFGAGLPEYCTAIILRTECASSLTSLESTTEKIQLGKAGLVIAGGMESMSRTPFLLERKIKISNPNIQNDFEYYLDDIGYGSDGRDPWYPKARDSMIYDGLMDVISPEWRKMGELADLCAKTYGISREEQEAYAYESFARARFAAASGKFGRQIVSVAGVSEDECIREPDIDKMRKLKPSFSEGGTVTAATSAQISDGSAVLLLGDRRSAMRLTGIEPRIRIVDFAICSQGPQWYTTAPADAIAKLLRKNGLKISDIDVFEINEAFAVVPLYAMRKLSIPHEKINIWGGAIAMGHPLGASGARLVMNAAQQLFELGGRCAVICACNNGGEARAVLIENITG